MAEESIKVVVRIRRLLDREKEQKKVFKVLDNSEIIHENSKKTWSFDRVFSDKDDNRAIYFNTVTDIIESAVSGFNATIFAYGQTSSGKTHTMMGNKEDPGVTKQAIEQLFFAVEDTPDRCFLMQVSYMEIYNEVVMDLLAKPSDRANSLKLRENEQGAVYVEGVTMVPVLSAEEVFALMEQGERNRHYAETKMNDRSSRSHTIFRIILESGNRMDDTEVDEENPEGHHVMISHLNLVDLAGSEKANQTGAEGSRLKEGGNINKSLMMLGQVIHKLSTDKSQFINYRDSKLTRLLQNSLGGNAKTAIIATITPAAMSEDQSISTLRFASQAKTIQTHATVNEVLDDQAKINRLQTELEEHKKEIEDLRLKMSSATSADVDIAKELMDQLDRERREKEEQMEKVRTLQEKIIVSSQPARSSSKKSLLLSANDRRVRRETWAAPRFQISSRQSFAFHAYSGSKKKLLEPLPANLNQLSQPQLELIPESPTKDDNDVEDNVFVAPRRKTVKFAPVSPRLSMSFSPGASNSSILDFSMDTGTPKALIRDRYKRVSRQLTEREQALEVQQEENRRLEKEFKELEEFARLESETGVLESRRSSATDAHVNDEVVRNLRKSFSDAEQLNLEVNKELRETKISLETLRVRHEELVEKHDKISSSEGKLRQLWEQLDKESAVQGKELKRLRELTSQLQMEKEDFDMKMELALGRKNRENEDLRKALESAYEDMAALEKCDKSVILERREKLEHLHQQVKELESKLAEQSAQLEERSCQAAEIKRLNIGLQMMSDQMETLSQEKSEIEQKMQQQRESIEPAGKVSLDELDELRRKISSLETLLKENEMKAANLELVNQSNLENIDELSRKNEQLSAEISELSSQLAQSELSKEESANEIRQLRDEINVLRKEKDTTDVILLEMKERSSEQTARIEELSTRVDREKEELIKEKEDCVKSLIADLKEKDAKIEILESTQADMISCKETDQVEIAKLTAIVNKLESEKLECESVEPKDLEEQGQMLQKALREIEKLESFKAQLIAAQEADHLEIQKLTTALNEKDAESKSMLSAKSDLKAKTLSRLNSTLMSLDETFKTCLPGDESVFDFGQDETLNATYGQNELMGMKNQLLMLQEQLINFDFDEFERRKVENQRLEALVAEMTAKHNVQLNIIQTKTREEMKLNFAALEDKIREEGNEQRALDLKEMKEKYESQIELLKNLNQSPIQSQSLPECNSSVQPCINDFSIDETFDMASKMMMGNSAQGEDSIGMQMLREENKKLQEQIEKMHDEISNKVVTDDILHDMRDRLESREKLIEELREEIEEQKNLGSTVKENDETENCKMIDSLKTELETKMNEVREKDQMVSELREHLEESRQSVKMAEKDPNSELDHIILDLKSELKCKETELQELQEVIEEQKRSAIKFDSDEIVNELKSKLESKESIIAQLQKDIVEQKNLVDSKASDKILSKDLEDLRLKLEEKEKEIIALGNDIVAKKELCTSLEQEHRREIDEIEIRMKKEMEDQTSSYIELEEQFKQNKESNLELKQNIDKLKAEICDKEKTIDEIEIKLRREAEDKTSSFTKIEEQFYHEKDLNLELKQSIDKLTAEVNQKDKAIDEIQIRLKKDAEDMKSSLSQLEEQHKREKESNLELQQSIDNLKAELTDNNKIIGQLKDDILQHKELVDNSKKDLTIESEKVDQLSGELQSKDASIKELEEKIAHINTLLNKVKSDMSAEQNQAISSLEEELEAKQRTIADLESRVSEQEKSKQSEKVARAELCEKVEAQNEELARKEKEMANLKNEMAEQEELMDRLEHEYHSRIALQKEFDENLATVKTLQEEVHNLQDEKSNLVAKLESTMQMESKELQTCKNDWDELKHKLDIEIDHRQQTEEKLREIEETVDFHVNQLKSKEKELLLAESKLESVCQEKTDLMEDLAKNEATRAEHEQLVLDLQSSRNEIEVLQKELQCQNQSVKQSEKNSEAMLMERDSVREELIAVQSRFDLEMKMAQEKYEDKIQEVEEELKRTKDNFKEAMENLEKINDEADKLEETLETTKREKMSLQAELDANLSLAAPPDQAMEQLNAEIQRLQHALDQEIKAKEELGLRLQKSAAESKVPTKNMAEIDKLQASSSKLQAENEKHLTEIERLRRKVGELNVMYGCLKVDVDRDELEFKKLNKQLEAKLNYEEERNHRLTGQIRQMQSERLETTVLLPQKSKSDKQTNTDSAAVSSDWEHGSGIVRNMLYSNMELRVKSLDKKIEKLEKEKDFYIDRGTNWKKKAVKFQEMLTERNVDLPNDEEIFKTTKVLAGKATAHRPAALDKENHDPDDLDLGLNVVVPPRNLKLSPSKRTPNNERVQNTVDRQLCR